MASLELRAKAVVEGFLAGLHRSPYHGYSAEFTEYRQYVAGDDPRYLDWRLLARSDRYYVKRFEDETNLRCYLLVDQSRSMQFGTLGYTKADYARTLAATLAYFLNLQRDAVGLMAFSSGVDEFLPARFRSGWFRRLVSLLQKEGPGKETRLADVLDRAAAQLRQRGFIVLISDMLADLSPLSQGLSYLRAAGQEVAVFQVLDPAEVTFQFRSAAMFEDLESGTELYIDPQLARASYLEKFQAHQSRLAECCRPLGVEFTTLTTDQPLERALFEFLQQRQR